MIGKAEESGTARSKLVVHLPADARLTIDGHATQSTADTRTFTTPALATGKTYYYTLKAEMDRNGEKVVTSRDITIRPGRDAEVYLEFPVARSRDTSTTASSREVKPVENR